MRYAIMSDVHSNLEALTAVLSNIKDHNVDKILCLGDIVGYGPNPNECIKLVNLSCETIIMGNHDFACINESEIEYFNHFARDAIIWTISNLTDFSRQFISELQMNAELHNFSLVHSSPDNPFTWSYILALDEAIHNFSYFETQICFIGHSHVPAIFIETADKNFSVFRKNFLKLEKNERYLINVGSVGQPRDFNSDAAYAVLDTKKNEYYLYRVSYNVERTQQKMRDAGLPTFLIDRLKYGR